jgi:hypothetical protein
MKARRGAANATGLMVLTASTAAGFGMWMLATSPLTLVAFYDALSSLIPYL